jgi:hypothetical protein
MLLMLMRCVICLAAIPLMVLGQPLRPNHIELRTLLAKDQHTFDLQVWYSIFYYEDTLRPSLRSLLNDRRARENARAVLALIGDPADLRLVVRRAPPIDRTPFSNRWAYGVACALLEPASEQEWAFLRACALNDYDDRWVDAGAIQTLKLIASPRSLEILQEVQRLNVNRAHALSEAIAYVLSNPGALQGLDLEALARRVASTNKFGKWEGNQKPRYNERRDKALVDIVYYAPGDRLTYTATFHRIDGLWRLRGLRETLQEAVMVMPVRPRTPLDLPSPPEILPVPSIPQSTLEMVLRPASEPSPPKREPPQPKR